MSLQIWESCYQIMFLIMLQSFLFDYSMNIKVEKKLYGLFEHKMDDSLFTLFFN
jgi:hypothetical protein